MDKLELVKQESKTDLLNLTAMPVPENYIHPGSCSWPVEKGQRKGENCGIKTFDGNKYCSIHQMLAIKRGEIIPEVDVPVKCSDMEKVIDIKDDSDSEEEPLENMELLSKFRNLKPVNENNLVIDKNIERSILPDLITVIKNFSLAIANLTEIIKK